MKKIVSLLLVAMLLFSSTIVFATNGKDSKKNNNSYANFQNQLNELERQFKMYHQNLQQQNKFLSQLEDLRNRMSDWDKNYRRSTLTIYINGTQFKSSGSFSISYNNINIPGDLITRGLGADLKLSGNSRIMNITKGSVKLSINLNNKRITLDGQEVRSNILSASKTNATIQLIKFIAETLGYKVNINEKERIIVIEGVSDTTPPTIPTSLSVIAQSTSQINLTWAASTDNNSVTGYKVFRNGSQISTVTNGTSFIDTGLAVGTSYSYSVAAYDAAGNNSAQSNAVVTSTFSSIGNGNGLRGEYFDNIDFTNLIKTNIDPFINFNWGTGSPSPSMGVDTFSIRWTGQLLPRYTEEYTFTASADDGVVLWVNGRKIINKWRDQSAGENKGRIRLTAGQKVNIRLEYYENQVDSSIKLYWSSKSQPIEIIPQSQLFSDISDNQAPSVPTGLTAVPFSATQINLSWAAASDNSGVAGYKIFRNGNQIGTVSNVTTYSDTGLTASTAYLYSISAYDSAGNNSAQSPQVYVVTTSNADTVAPTIPAGLTAAAASATQVNLNWNASTDNLGVTGYKVFRGGVQIGTVTNATSYIDTGLLTNTSYSYSVSAFDAAGNNSSQCALVTVVTPAVIGNGNGLWGEYFDNSDFTNQKLSRIDSKIDFNWGTGAPDPSMGNDTFSIRWTGQVAPLFTEEYTFNTVSDDGVRLWVNGVKLIDNWNLHSALSDNGKIKLNAGQKYDIRLEYFDNTGDTAIKLSWSSPSQPKQVIPQSQLFGVAVADSAAPTVPTGLTAVAASATQVNLNWTASTDNIGVTGYKVFRGGVQLATVPNATVYVDSGLTASTSYSYTVLAYDAVGNNSAPSTAVTIVTPAVADTQAPTVPAGLNAASVTASQINLSWTASTDNIGVTGYKIFRGGVQISTVTNVTAFIDTGLTANTVYSYTVSAFDAAGNNSAQSQALSVTTKFPPLTTINDNTIGTGDNQFNYSANWSYGNQTGAYLNDNHWSGTADAFYQVQFTGTQVKLYGAKDAAHGIAKVMIDDNIVALVDFYAAARADNVLVFTSQQLQRGQHKLKVVVTGTKNNSATNNYIPADRVETIDG